MKKPAKKKPSRPRKPARPRMSPELKASRKRDAAIATELVETLARVKGTPDLERRALRTAIAKFMANAYETHASPGETTGEVMCGEFFWEGDRDNEPVYTRVADATRADSDRWFELLNEELAAFDATVER